jgi:glyoxylase-like metal-dependent hydrolase (beta-lactamase superfamily II)
MQMESVLVGAFGVNCLILWDDPAHAVVVDPGAEADAIEAVLKRHGLAVAAYWLTHGHIDHLSALGDMLAKRPAPVHLHKADASWAFMSANRYPPYLRTPARPDSLETVEDGAVLAAGGLSARVIHTPGHTPGGVCYWLEGGKTLLSGDTLFQGSVGRTDLPGGDTDTLMKSLVRLLALDNDVKVYPGHGPDSTIGYERRHNPFLKELAEARQ